MAHLLGADAVSLTLGTQVLLDSVSLGLDDGDRIGVVGGNGAGKTTLLRVLAGAQPPDDGRVTRAGGVTFALLDQRDDHGHGTTVRGIVHGTVPDHVWASDARIRSIHAGLLGDLDLDSDLGSLSGGQRRRVALAALLVRDDEVLALDEPTNHLDVEGVAWLAEHVRERFGRGRGALVVVTHDRWFLDAVCTHIWEVHDGIVEASEGGYAAYVLARAERARLAAQGAEKRANVLRKELAWLRRGAPARTSKPRFRIDAATALIADEPPPRDDVALTKLATARLGKDVLELEDVGVTFDEPVLRDVTWQLGPGDRFGVVGVNGSGKTTLLRLLSGDLQPSHGKVRRGKTVRVAMLSQDVSELDELADLRPVEVIERERREVTSDGKELTAAQLTERLGFSRERAWTPVRDLSGGERRRLQLLRLLVGEPNVLLLDEPTNDLDTDTLASFEDLLDTWPGTLVVVSHDRYLLERVCDRHLALLGDGRLRDLPGGVEEYLRLRRLALLEVAAQAPTPTSRVPGSSGADVHAARKDLQRIERRLARIAKAEQRLHARIVEQATDHIAVLALDTQLRELAAERTQLEDEWLEAAETAQ